MGNLLISYKNIFLLFPTNWSELVFPDCKDGSVSGRRISHGVIDLEYKLLKTKQCQLNKNLDQLSWCTSDNQVKILE